MSSKLDNIIASLPDDDIEYPLDQWDPPDCGLGGFRIDQEGRWYFNDSIIQRPAMVRLFSKLLKREGDRYFVISPVEKVAVDVALLPFCVVLADFNHNQAVWRFTLNNDALIELDEKHPLKLSAKLIEGQVLPIIKVRRELFAFFHRNAYYHLVNHAITKNINGKDIIGINSKKEFYPLEPLA